jgi:hypothetical protein
MGWYLRKSLGFGPLRINLSKSGLGGSVGVKGLRVGSGPRGPYLHAGRGGLYYRTSLKGRRGSPEAAAEAPETYPELLPETPAAQAAGGALESEAATAVPGRKQLGVRLLRKIFGQLMRR